MTNTYLLFFLLLICASSESIKLDSKCACAEIKSKSDCVSANCSWITSASGTDSCTTASSNNQESASVSVLCNSQLSPENDCKTIFGCAYHEKRCVQFAGCSAYFFKTNGECQTASQLCTTNGTKCIDPLKCVDYTNEEHCTKNVSSSGSKRCIWNPTESKCRDQLCTEADITHNTDLKCDRFMKGCLTTGKGCTSTRALCNSYTSDCDQMIGSDGYCESSKEGRCQVKECSKAPTNARSDAECNRFQFGCVTTGRGCVRPPLPNCSQYTGTLGECQIMTGADGKCDGQSATNTTSTNSCRVRECQLASTTINTDELCATYKPGCVTNGLGCVAQRQACSTYSGTPAQCQSYIGSDGRCDGVSATGPCKAKACTDAPTSYTTDVLCSGFQFNCVTTGAGCVATRPLCSSYTGTEATCALLIGSDGKCKGTGTTTLSCSTKVCSQAPTSIVTHAGCADYQTGCITNGAGCTSAKTCLLTERQLACTGTPSCTWNNICVNGSSCASYTTVALCLNNKAVDKSCFWTGQLCRELLCTDAPNTSNTNEQCDTFLKGCLTNGQGCLPPTSPCSAYNGTKVTCLAFKGNGKLCFSTSEVSAACRDKLCTDDITSTTDVQCDVFLAGCKTKGTGCIAPSEPCISYSGDVATCSRYVAVNGAQKCYQNANTTGSCRNLACEDDTTSTSDGACDTFLKGCLTKGTGCISPTMACTAYAGTSIDACRNFKGQGLACWWASGNNCVVKLCTHNTTATTDSECEGFLSGCVTKGQGCVNKIDECLVYQGNETTCMTFKGNLKPCHRKNNCVDRACSDLSAPRSQEECQTYLSTCSFNGANCIQTLGTCESYLNLRAEICQILKSSSNVPCWLDSGVGQCVTKQCSHKGSATNQAECDAFLPGSCIHSGSICVPKQATCSAYTNFTQQACKLAVTTSGVKCWKVTDVLGSCEDRACNQTINDPNTDNCKAHLSTCVFNGTSCTLIQATCAAYTAFTQAACKAVVTSTDEKCWKEAGGTGACESRQCSNTVSAPNKDNCLAHRASCRYNGTTCVNAQTTCSAYTDFTQDACRQVTLDDGVTFCWRVATTNGTCEVRSCSQSLTAYSGQACLAHISTCRFDGMICQDAQASCGLYTQFTQDACKTVRRIDGRGCWKATAAVGICEERTCNDPVPNPSSGTCAAHLPTCRFTGSICTEAQTACGSYSNFTSEQCRAVTLSDGTTKCWKTSASNGFCEERTCDNNVPNPSQANCAAHMSVCVFNGTSCQLAQTLCSNYTNMLASQCQTILTSTSGKCWLQGGIGNCIDRICEHNVDATSDEACQSFLAGCKTTGKGCVSATVTCAQIQGTQSSCLSVKGSSTHLCKGQNTAGQCSTRTCYDNMDATTDADCSAFLAGCVTRGKGCLPATALCSAYNGTRAACFIFTGNGRKCYNTEAAIATTPCVERRCQDDMVSTTDMACEAFQTGCVTKGIGCIDKSLPCSNYVGTQGDCANFRGTNGTRRCWNLQSATSITPCIDRQCSHNTRATTDKECEAFLPGCVNKGSGCSAPQPCASFLGTLKSCPKFSALDKPCKGQGNQINTCVSQTCQEAPSSFNTDQQCNTFKSGCVTNGQGCVAIANCEDLITQDVCTAKAGCIFVGSCREIQTECSIFRTASLCINTPVQTSTKRCSWTNGVCRNWTCLDAPETITTESGCESLHTSCTSRGKGCVTKGPCASYTTSVMCSTARTTDVGDTCMWQGTACRAKSCEDASKGFKTDEQCDGYLKGCKTIGQGCMLPPFTCEAIVKKERCTLDTTLRPCIWMNQKCLNYAKCQDIQKQTHAECQQYSLQCTSDGVSCIPFDECSSYKTSISCVNGIDGVCGWVLGTITTEAKCQKFSSCEEAPGTDSQICKTYNSGCVSNGVNCVKYDTCGSYKSTMACAAGGSDGACFWDTSKSECRLRECKDANTSNAASITSYKGCSEFKASKKCTTDGAGCIDQDLCSSYLEASCFWGTDGECIYTFPEGQVQGTKVCRLKVCSDFTESVTERCEASLKGCISNGTTCQSKQVCSSYTTKMACNSGGSDGICVFTPSGTDQPSSGTCKLMAKCEDANNDQIACNAKKACQYQTTLKDGVQATKCNEHTCASIAEGGSCKSLPHFDGVNASICVPTQNGCEIGESSQLSSANCFSLTSQVFSWNQQTNFCQICKEIPNAPSGNDNPSPGTQNPGTPSSKSMILALILVNILAIQ